MVLILKGTENPEINPHICGQFFVLFCFYKDDDVIQWQMDSLFKNGTGASEYPYGKMKILDPCPTPYTKIKLKCIMDPNIKAKTRGFPGGTVVKNPPANAGDTGLSPGPPGRSHMPWSN